MRGGPSAERGDDAWDPASASEPRMAPYEFALARWETRWDPDHEAYYYYDARSGFSTWEDPGG
jgi:hypothetical protein